MSNLYNILRGALFRVPSMVNVSNFIAGGSEVVGESLVDLLSMEISAQAAEVFFPPDILGGIQSCCQVDIFLYCRLVDFFGLLLVPKRFPVLSGLQSYHRYCSAPAINFLVSLLPELLSFHSVTKKVSWDIFPDP